SVSRSAFRRSVARLVPAVTRGRPDPGRVRGACPGGAAGRHAGRRLPDRGGRAGGACAERAVPGGHRLAADRRGDRPPGADPGLTRSLLPPRLSMSGCAASVVPAGPTRSSPATLRPGTCQAGGVPAPTLVLWDIDHTLIETRGVGRKLYRAA